MKNDLITLDNVSRFYGEVLGVNRVTLSVPPGITGAWQVSGRSELSFEQMVELDVSYIERWSVELDLKIMLQTVPAVLKLGGK